MKRVITLCLALTLAVGAVSAKAVKNVNFESGETKGVTPSKGKDGSTTPIQVVDVNRSEKNKKALEISGAVTAPITAEKAGTNYKLSIDTKVVAGNKPGSIMVKYYNAESKKSETIATLAIPTDTEEFKTSTLEFKAPAKGKVNVIINPGVKNAKLLIDNLKIIDLDNK